MAAEDGVHDLKLLLGSKERSFLVRNNGDEVEIGSIEGKLVALYFSASWCGPCRRFTPNLVEAYDKLSSRSADGFEVVFISCDQDDDGFSEYFSKMPWLAVPFSDKTKRAHLNDLFKVKGIPCLVLLDGSGKVYCRDAVRFLSDHGSDAYPFTPDKIKELEEQEEIARKEVKILSLLVTPSRDFLISNNGDKVPVSDLEGKILGIYFAVDYPPCQEFTPLLVDMYEKLKHRGEDFEIVLISLDRDEESFSAISAGMPWLLLPLKDESREKLTGYFEYRGFPALVVIGSDGKTLQDNVVDAIENHGVDAYPFTIEKMKELEEKEKAKADSQTLESLLVSGELDYVIGKDGNKVAVSDLVGKNILLYFSAHWCGPCCAFTPKFAEEYHNIKEKDGSFEVIFVSSDEDRDSFDEYYASMPWLALPFGDKRKKRLSKTFEISGIPAVVALGPTGRTVAMNARDLIAEHGAEAYPFTEERQKELEAARVEEKAEGCPEKVKHSLHEHELHLTRRPFFVCDGCEESKTRWSFCCKECDFDLHPECALNDSGKAEDREEGGAAAAAEEDAAAGGKEGYVCYGDVCYKV